MAILDQAKVIGRPLPNQLVASTTNPDELITPKLSPSQQAILNGVHNWLDGGAAEMHADEVEKIAAAVAEFSLPVEELLKKLIFELRNVADGTAAITATCLSELIRHEHELILVDRSEELAAFPFPLNRKSGTIFRQFIEQHPDGPLVALRILTSCIPVFKRLGGFLSTLLTSGYRTVAIGLKEAPDGKSGAEHRSGRTTHSRDREAIEGFLRGCVEIAPRFYGSAYAASAAPIVATVPPFDPVTMTFDDSTYDSYQIMRLGGSLVRHLTLQGGTSTNELNRKHPMKYNRKKDHFEEKRLPMNVLSIQEQLALHNGFGEARAAFFAQHELAKKSGRPLVWWYPRKEPPPSLIERGSDHGSAFPRFPDLFLNAVRCIAAADPANLIRFPKDPQYSENYLACTNARRIPIVIWNEAAEVFENDGPTPYEVAKDIPCYYFGLDDITADVISILGIDLIGGDDSKEKYAAARAARLGFIRELLDVVKVPGAPSDGAAQSFAALAEPHNKDHDPLTYVLLALKWGEEVDLKVLDGVFALLTKFQVPASRDSLEKTIVSRHEIPRREKAAAINYLDYRPRIHAAMPPEVMLMTGIENYCSMGLSALGVPGDVNALAQGLRGNALIALVDGTQQFTEAVIRERYARGYPIPFDDFVSPVERIVRGLATTVIEDQQSSLFGSTIVRLLPPQEHPRPLREVLRSISEFSPRAIVIIPWECAEKYGSMGDLLSPPPHFNGKIVLLTNAPISGLQCIEVRAQSANALREQLGAHAYKIARHLEVDRESVATLVPIAVDQVNRATRPNEELTFLTLAVLRAAAQHAKRSDRVVLTAQDVAIGAGAVFAYGDAAEGLKVGKRILAWPRDARTRIIGQDMAMSKLADIVAAHRAGFAKDGRGCAIVLVGRTGIGKTLIAKSIAQEDGAPIFIVDSTAMRERRREILSSSDVKGSLASFVLRNQRGYTIIDDADRLDPLTFGSLMNAVETAAPRDGKSGRELVRPQMITLILLNYGADTIAPDATDAEATAAAIKARIFSLPEGEPDGAFAKRLRWIHVPPIKENDFEGIIRAELSTASLWRGVIASGYTISPPSDEVVHFIRDHCALVCDVAEKGRIGYRPPEYAVSPSHRHFQNMRAVIDVVSSLVGGAMTRHLIGPEAPGNCNTPSRLEVYVRRETGTLGVRATS